MNDPKVSVIVPIYNAEDFLNRCIDSLVYQTLEDIEILLVDNLSEDNSYSVMKSYEAAFPDKVRAFQLPVHYDGPGAGRNLGLAHAKADYIGFADSDDYFEYDAFKKMYNKAIEEDCDLVYCASYDVKDGKKKLTRALPTGSKEEILTIGSMVFWNKLIRRSLFEKAGKIPEAMVFEDLAYLPQIVSAAKKIGYINEPLYYYIIREDSGVNTLDPDRVLKELDALEYSISQLCGEELDVFLDSVGMRLCNDIRDRWQFTDAYIKEIKKLGPYLVKSKTLLNDKRNWPRVKRYLDLPDETIPNIVYIPDILENLGEDEIKNYKESLFYNDAELNLIGPKTSDNGNCELIGQMQNNGKYNLLCFYVGLCSIYETGGIYLHPSLKLCAPLNFTKYNEAFFSYSSSKEFSDRIFGAKKGNPIIKRMIEIIEDNNADISPSAVIKKILNEGLNIPLVDKTNIYDFAVSVYATSVFIKDTGAKLHISKQSDTAEYILAKRIRSDIKEKWANLDHTLEKLKKVWPLISDDKLVKKNPSLYRYLENYAALNDVPISKNVYLNGFEHSYSDAELHLIAERIYDKDAKIVVLSEENCDIKELSCIESAYSEGNLSFVSEYFALKNISLNDGIYINHNIEIDSTFNFIRCFPAFIGYCEEAEFSSDVFGGHKDNAFLLAVLNTYKNDKCEEEHMPLASRMKHIVINDYGKTVSGSSDYFSLRDVAIFNMRYLTLNVTGLSETQPHLCHVKYFENDSEYIVVPKTTWNFVSPLFKNELTTKMNKK